MSQTPREERAAKNTDRELWREKEGDYYSPSIHVTEGGGIGMNVGGHVVVMPIQKWHALALRESAPAAAPVQVSPEMLMEAVAMVQDEGLWKFDQPKWYEVMASAIEHLLSEIPQPVAGPSELALLEARLKEAQWWQNNCRGNSEERIARMRELDRAIAAAKAQPETEGE